MSINQAITTVGAQVGKKPFPLGRLLTGLGIGAAGVYYPTMAYRRTNASMGDLRERLDKVAPALTREPTPLLNLEKESSEKIGKDTQMNMSKRAELIKKAADTQMGLTPYDMLPSVIAGDLISGGLTGLTGQNVTGPSSGMIGKIVSRGMFPGTSGMIERADIPENILSTATGRVGGAAGDIVGNRVTKLIGNLTKKRFDTLYASPRRQEILKTLHKEDELIKELPKQRALEAYHSMTKVAPTISLDKNAVKSFLREIAISPEGGINWNTLKGLAEAESSVNRALERE